MLLFILTLSSMQNYQSLDGKVPRPMVAHNVTITGYPLPGINFPNHTEKKSLPFGIILFLKRSEVVCIFFQADWKLEIVTVLLALRF